MFEPEVDMQEPRHLLRRPTARQVAGGKVFVGSLDFPLRARRKTGAVAWKVDDRRPQARYTVTGAPELAGDR